LAHFVFGSAIRQSEVGFVFFALPPPRRWIKYLAMGFCRVVIAAEPPNRAVDQIPQFVVGNSRFL
jgi:hypothetical protein